jgi:hypothetical protein
MDYLTCKVLVLELRAGKVCKDYGFVDAVEDVHSLRTLSSIGYIDDFSALFPTSEQAISNHDRGEYIRRLWIQTAQCIEGEDR